MLQASKYRRSVLKGKVKNRKGIYAKEQLLKTLLTTKILTKKPCILAIWKKHDPLYTPLNIDEVKKFSQILKVEDKEFKSKGKKMCEEILNMYVKKCETLENVPDETYLRKSAIV